MTTTPDQTKYMVINIGGFDLHFLITACMHAVYVSMFSVCALIVV
jgi:hypothetical protein